VDGKGICSSEGGRKEDDFPCALEGCIDKTPHVHVEEQDKETEKVETGSSFLWISWRHQIRLDVMDLVCRHSCFASELHVE
jgi:hypothetical protein